MAVATPSLGAPSPTATPSATASPAPTASPRRPLRSPVPPASSSTSVPVTQPSDDSPDHTDAGLEALLPAVVDGVTMLRVSGRGIEGERDGRVEVAFLELLGAQDADYSYAAAMPVEQLDLLVQAFRVRGAERDALRNAFVQTFLLSTGPISLGLFPDDPIPQDKLTLDGKEVVKLHGPESAVYLYARDDIVFAVWTSDENLAHRVVADLPD